MMRCFLTRASAVGAVLAMATTLTSVASANGRFPRAQRLVVSADQPAALALYGTYGLLLSSDSGESWGHVCETATGPYTGEDPLLELMPAARVLLRTEIALVKSGDSWCNFDSVLGAEKEEIQDITRDPTNPQAILALQGGYDAVAGFSTHFLSSSDAGATWSTPVELPKASLARGLSLDVAPSKSSRIYATGLDGDGKGELAVSEDSGKTWKAHLLGDTTSDSAPYIAFVMKADPNTLFVRTDTYEVVGAIDTAGDTLLVTKDGGATFHTLIKRAAKLLGVALSPDEKTLLLGYGDPMVAGTDIVPDDLGLYRARVEDILADPDNAESHFEKIYDGSVTCLRWTADALFACTAQAERGFEVGKARDAEFNVSAMSGAEPFTSLLRLPEVRPLSCNPGTDAYACYTDTGNGFPFVCTAFQAPCDVKPPTGTGGTGGAPSSGGAGGSSASGGTTAPASGGAANSGGAATSSGGASASTGGAGSGGAAPAKHDDSSCAHRSLGNAPSFGGALMTLLAAAAAARRRRAR